MATIKTTKQVRNGSSNNYLFEDYSFDAEHLELSRGGELIELRLQPARLLKMLLENSPNIVSRTTLQDSIWDSGTRVEFDLGLNVCMNQLRTALGDSASNPRYIETLPKRGYRFIPQVEIKFLRQKRSRLLFGTAVVSLVLLSAIGIWLAVSGRQQASPVKIYVAPVQVDGAEVSAFDGVAQYALRLGTIERLMSNDSQSLAAINGDSLWKNPDEWRAGEVFDYKLFMTLSAADKGYLVDAIVIGQETSREVNKKAFLVDQLDAVSMAGLSDDISIWSSAIFGVQKERREQNYKQYPAGYFDAMIQARRDFQVGDPASLESSVSWFDKALEISPESIDAKSGKALALAVLSGGNKYPAARTYATALSLTEQVRQMAGPTAQTELVRGFIFLYRDWDVNRSRQAFDLAIELEPGNALAHAWRAGVLAAQGDAQSAASEADTAVGLDPLSMSVNADRCWYLGAADRYQEAVSACNLALEIEPGHFLSRFALVMALEHLGRQQQALDMLRLISNALKPRQGNHLLQVNLDNQPDNLTTAYCETAQQLEAYAEDGQFPLVQLAAFKARCGEYEIASKLLVEAKRMGESGVLFYAVDPKFKEFRSQPESQNIDMRIDIR